MNPYSYSCLTKANRRVEIFSAFVCNGIFWSYLVEVKVFDDKGKFRKRIQKSFAKIEDAEALHQNVVLRCTETRGYEIVVTMVK